MPLFAKSALFDVELINAPPNNRYSIINPIVNGNLHIKFRENVKKVNKISLTFSGSVYVKYDAFHKIDPKTKATEKISKTSVLDKYQLFEIELDLEVPKNKSSNNLYSFTSDEEIDCKFQVEFPQNTVLPSAVSCFDDDDDGDILVNYHLEFKIEKQGFRNKSKIYASHKESIPFQSGVNLTEFTEIKILGYHKKTVIKDKIKKFSYDEMSKALIPTSLENSHLKTKNFRQLWDDRFTTDNLAKLIRTIPLTVSFAIPTILDLKTSFVDQIQISISSNLLEYGFNSNDSVEFKLDRQSTKLGYFEIKKLEIELNYKTKIITDKELLVTVPGTFVLSKIDFNNLNFDICDFTEDTKGNYKFDLTSEMLCNHTDTDINKPLYQFSDEILCCPDDRFLKMNYSSSTLSFKLTIDDGMGKTYDYEFETFSTPGFLMNKRILGDSYNVPPPMYSESITLSSLLPNKECSFRPPNPRS